MNKKIFLLVVVVAASFSQAAMPVSPMAKLMRQMLAFLDLERQNITQNKPAQEFPKSFAKINTAKLTEGKKPSADHVAYIQNFQKGLSSYYENIHTPQRTSNFNLLVSSCITCHEHECPGPIQRIEKNLVK